MNLIIRFYLKTFSFNTLCHKVNTARFTHITKMLISSFYFMMFILMFANHDRHVRVMNDVITDATKNRPPEGALAPTSDNN